MTVEELLAEIIYSIYPPINSIGGQQVGVPCGVKGEHPLGIIAVCQIHRSQHKNKQAVRDMIEYTLTGLL